MKKQLLAIYLCALMVGTVFSEVAVADNAIEIKGKKYEFDGSNDYEISDADHYAIITTEGTSYGKFSFSGDLEPHSYSNGFDSYQVNSGEVVFNYTLNTSLLSESVDWYVGNDKNDDVDGMELDKDVATGAIIVQSSLDGEKWVTDTYMCDIMSSSNYNSDFYKSQEIQLINGCYYKIIVAYELKKPKTDDNFFDYLVHTIDTYDYARYAEVYTLYLQASDKMIGSTVKSTDGPKTYLGSVVRTGLDNGFAGEGSVLKTDDPHFGWEIGHFFMNGYTSEQSVEEKGEDIPVFLKTVGDRVTLWFDLEQDIEKLDGDSNLYIVEDKDAKDEHFGVKNKNFKHGTLIVNYVNKSGVKKEPTIYTDFLAANAKNGADTRIQLFEEGDYEVSLDYEVRKHYDNPFTPDDYYNYKIYFKFKIRNGNCRVFAKDIKNGSILADKSYTQNGFKLDRAESMYISMDVKKDIVTLTDGILIVRNEGNSVKDEKDEFTANGIYTITVKNDYVPELTKSVVYVGNDKYINAYRKKDGNLDEINNLLKEGYTISDSGDMVPPETTEEPTTEETTTEEITTEMTEIETTLEVAETTIVIETIEKIEETADSSTEAVIAENNNDGNNIIVIVMVGIISLLLGGGAVYFVLKKKVGVKE